MDANTTGDNNVAVGYSALGSNTTGAYNVAIGGQGNGATTMGANTTASYNTGVGAGALSDNSTGSSNSAFGYRALGANTTGAENVAVGTNALNGCTTGTQNTAVGFQSLIGVTTGVGNVALGRRAGARITTGSENICIGDSPGDYVNYLTTGSNNILVGYGTQSSGTGSTHEIVIATALGVQGKGNNTAFISPNGGGAYNGGNTTTWTTTSDQRIKKNIVDNTQGLDLVNQIRVRNFEYRLPEEVDGGLLPSDAVKKEGIQLGVIAQEIQQVLPECVTSESTGVLSVNSDNLIWYAINAIKELNTRLQAAEAEIATLKGA